LHPAVSPTIRAILTHALPGNAKPEAGTRRGVMKPE
jgi:hypothetical protein